MAVSRGTAGGSATETMVFGVRKPEAIVALLLMSDGDASRQNRGFLLNKDLAVGGMGCLLYTSPSPRD